MKIGIDCSRLFVNQPTGVEVYGQKLIPEIIKQNPSDIFVLYTNTAPKKEWLIFEDNVTWKVIDKKHFWTQIYLAKELANPYGRPDLMFFPSHVPPYFCPIPYIATIHDVSWRKFCSSYSWVSRIYLEVTTKRSVKKARAIITPSYSTKNELVKYYNIDSKEVYVIHHGVEANIYHKTKNDYEPYILYIGRIETKKNILNLIDAFALLKQEKYNTHHLVMVGKKGFGFESIRKKIYSIAPEVLDQIKIYDYLEKEKLDQLLANASLLVVPSGLEGFGLPALEAMSAGVPVAVANVGALPEVVAQAGIYFDPDKPFSIAAACSKIIHNDKIKEEFVRSGKEVAKKYTWTKSARLTAEVLHGKK